MANDNETVEQVCEFFHYRLNAKGCFGSPFVSYAHKHGDNDTLVVYIRKTFNEFKERVMAALKREILVETNLADAHIFSLLEKIDARDAEIANRNALIKELADALHGMEEVLTKVRKSAWWMDARFDEIMAVNNVMTKADDVIAKAREVLG